MATYATLNPSDKGANISLSNGNKTGTLTTTDGYQTVRSTISVTSGKWYWEVVFTGVNAALFGIANASATLTNFVGSDANGWAYFVSAQKYNNGTGTAYGATWASGDVIGVALDMDGGTLIFNKNNVSQGTAFTGLTGTIFAAMSINKVSESFTVNFGATALTYSPPGGYNAGLYTGGGANNLTLTGVGS